MAEPRPSTRPPGYAKAWADIANELRWLEGVAVGGHQPARRERALEAAERAVALAADLPDGYVARGRIRRGFLRDYRGALADLERARALGPSDVGASWALGQILLTFGRLPEAITELKRAVELDPLLARAWMLLGQAEVSAGQHARGQASLARALEISPGGDEARYYLVADLLTTGRPDAALDVATKAKMPWVRLPGVSMAQHDLGRPRESQEALNALVEGSSADAAFNVAEVHAWRGHSNQAFEWLERARIQGDSGLPWIKADPLLRKIHGDPRWATLLKKLNLPVD